MRVCGGEVWASALCLDQNLVYHPRFLHTGQPEIQSLEPVGEGLVIDPELVHHRRVQVSNVDWILGDVVTETANLFLYF